jgi:hypothetical protein
VLSTLAGKLVAPGNVCHIPKKLDHSLNFLLKIWLLVAEMKIE